MLALWCWFIIMLAASMFSSGMLVVISWLVKSWLYSLCSWQLATLLLGAVCYKVWCWLRLCQCIFWFRFEGDLGQLAGRQKPSEGVVSLRMKQIITLIFTANYKKISRETKNLLTIADSSTNTFFCRRQRGFEFFFRWVEMGQDGLRWVKVGKEGWPPPPPKMLLDFF